MLNKIGITSFGLISSPSILDRKTPSPMSLPLSKDKMNMHLEPLEVLNCVGIWFCFAPHHILGPNSSQQHQRQAILTGVVSQY